MLWFLFPFFCFGFKFCSFSGLLRWELRRLILDLFNTCIQSINFLLNTAFTQILISYFCSKYFLFFLRFLLWLMFRNMLLACIFFSYLLLISMCLYNRRVDNVQLDLTFWPTLTKSLNRCIVPLVFTAIADVVELMSDMFAIVYVCCPCSLSRFCLLFFWLFLVLLEQNNKLRDLYHRIYNMVDTQVYN